MTQDELQLWFRHAVELPKAAVRVQKLAWTVSILPKLRMDLNGTGVSKYATQLRLDSNERKRVWSALGALLMGTSDLPPAPDSPFMISSRCRGVKLGWHMHEPHDRPGVHRYVVRRRPVIVNRGPLAGRGRGGGSGGAGPSGAGKPQVRVMPDGSSAPISSVTSEHPHPHEHGWREVYAGPEPVFWDEVDMEVAYEYSVMAWSRVGHSPWSDSSHVSLPKMLCDSADKLLGTGAEGARGERGEAAGGRGKAVGLLEGGSSTSSSTSKRNSGSSGTAGRDRRRRQRAPGAPHGGALVTIGDRRHGKDRARHTRPP